MDHSSHPAVVVANVVVAIVVAGTVVVTVVLVVESGLVAVVGGAVVVSAPVAVSKMIFENENLNSGLCCDKHGRYNSNGKNDTFNIF